MAPYNYYQSTISSNWTIAHKLGSSVIAIDVFIPAGNGVYTKVMPSRTEIIDDNTVSVVFTTPQSGRARIVSQMI